jgi:hypothetical protein
MLCVCLNEEDLSRRGLLYAWVNQQHFRGTSLPGLLVCTFAGLQVEVLRLQVALARRCASHALPFSLAADPELSELVRLLNLPACQGLGTAAACSEAQALLEAEQVGRL